jgi:hypothetical protein
MYAFACLRGIHRLNWILGEATLFQNQGFAVCLIRTNHINLSTRMSMVVLVQQTFWAKKNL